MSNISRRKSRRTSSGTVRSCSTLATAESLLTPRYAPAMRLVEQWAELQRRLPEVWDEARLLLVVEHGDPDRAAALLGPANPGRRRDAIVLVARPLGGPASPEGVIRLLRRLDREGIAGRLELVSTAETETEAPDETGRHSLAAAWDDALAKLPPDWSDVLAEAHFRSSDQVARAALLLSPLNPGRPPAGEATTLRFRSARRYGYGASPGMVRRCLARCDEERIRGEVDVLLALSDTHPVGTQGPVWYLDGRPA